MTALATADQVRAIQTARRRQGLDEPAYRAALAGFGVASSKALTVDQAGQFIDRLNGARSGVERPSRDRATGPYAKKLQALWLAGYNLGVVRDPHDAAMTALVERQTGLSHTRFLRDPADAGRAIEAIKGMLARDGGVLWPVKPGPGAIEFKRAVVAAQYQRLATLGLYPDLRPFHALSPAELDGLSKRLGAELRAALARAAA